ncbi:MAG TPA: hypothetical protein VKV95_16420 [Terriglobia bacterium]|nr:hypothetical protein [Terriglobia bacterium]
MKNWKRVLVLSLLVLAAVPLGATETAFWQVGTFDELLQGTLEGVSLSKEGELRLAPDARALFSPDETMALSIAADRHNNLYLGTGQQGKVFKVDSSRKGSLFFTAPEPQIFAMTMGSDGALYVGSSPEGKIYRVTPDGQSKVFYTPKAKYIWALTFDAEGRLFAGTGDRGLIYVIDPNGKGEVFFDSKQTHIMCLIHDPAGNLIAGSDPNGLIYRITPKGKAFVIYQAPLPEIHDLAADSKGRIYAAALGGAGGSVTPGTWGPQNPATPAQAAVTVTVDAESEDAKTKEGPAQSPSAPAPAPSFNHPAQAPQGFVLPTSPQGKGSLIQILPDSSAETVWTSNNESIFGLAIRNDRVAFSTDANGRIFELSPSADGQELTLLTETHDSLATRLLAQGNDLYAATSNIAKLVEVGSGAAHEGNYTSPVKDTKFISRWGVIAWRGEVPPGTSLEFFTRSGNSDRPDQTWSDWAGPYRDPNGSPILNPPARYIQWKADFHSTAQASPTLDDATVSYLNQNLAPQIRSFSVSTSGERTGPGGASSFSSSSPGSVTVTSGNSVSFSPPPSSSVGGIRTPTTLSWQVDDPNGDQLVYSLYLKAEDEQNWHLVKDKLHQTSFTLDPQGLADGKYVARLVASDEESNSPAEARKADLLSAPFWIDNSPPEVRVLKQTVTGDSAEIQFRAEDATSPLRAAETTTDSKDWGVISSDDGVVDSRVETFTVRVHNLEPGEHIIALRASDTAGNIGVGKAVIRIQAATRPGH